MQNGPEKPIRIVIAGGGFGGVYTYKQLHNYFHGDSRVELVLINRENYFLFTPLLHEAATGGVSLENTIEPIRKVLNCCLHALYVADITKISFAEKKVETTLGDVPYDYLVLALGAETNYYGISGAAAHTMTLKTLDDARAMKNRFLEIFERASLAKTDEELDALLSFAVIGGGPTGVELSAEMSEFFFYTLAPYYKGKDFAKHIKIHLIHRDPQLLLQFSEKLRIKALTALQREHGIKVHLSAEVTSIEERAVVLKSGERIEASTIVWVAGTKPSSVPVDDAETRGPNGKFRAKSTFQLEKYPNVIALGDAASVIAVNQKNPLPALAQVATKQSVGAALNVARLIEGKEPKEFAYKHSGDMLSLGHWLAMGEIHGFSFIGHLAWWVWRTVYLFKLISWQKRLRVAVDWTINLFAKRDISRY